MVSARLVECPDVPEEPYMHQIPEMMFAAGEEPVGVRVLTYQSSSVLKRIFNALDEEELDIIRRSSFGKLIEIADKPVFSGRFAQYLLSRQLKTKKKHKAWFRFAGKPVRFSMREFAIVTGLPCGKFPQKSKMKLKATIAEQPYWPCLFRKVEVVTVSSVIKMLYRKTVKDRDIHIKYACLAFLESVLLPTILNMKICREHVEAIKDLEAFFAFPWGRVAFDMLMGSIKERDEIALSKNTIAVKRFVLALQLVMVAAVPALTEAVQDSCSSSDSDSEDIDGPGCDIFTKKRTLNPAHACNVDKRNDVIVDSILVEDPLRPIDEANLVRSDEEHDSRVDNMSECIRRNYQFNNSCKRSKKVISPSSDVEESYIVDLVLETIKPQIDIIECNITVASSRLDAIEGNVRVQVEALLGKFKEEMLSSVKDIVSALWKDHIAAHNAGGNSQPSSPTNVTVPACHTSHVADANAKTIQNVLRDISQYSTPPRSNHISEAENPTPTKKDHVESGYVCGTPVIQSCAQSANSENRSRQNLRLGISTTKTCRMNLHFYSLGLTQEEQIHGDSPIYGKNDHELEHLSINNVADNIEGSILSWRSKRQKTVTTGLVEDYLCGPHLIVINVSRLAVSRREINLVVERLCNYSAKLTSEGSQSAAFLDTKFVAAIIMNFPKFLKSKNKDTFLFPKALTGILPTKEVPKVNPTKFYFPFNVGNKHWVGICFDAVCGTVTILDSGLALHKEKAMGKIISPVVQMLPYLARYACLEIGIMLYMDLKRVRILVLMCLKRKMTTPLRVSLYHGAWRRDDDEHWSFHRKPSDLGYTVLVKPTEMVEDLECMIRERYKLKPETPMVMAYHPPDWMLEPVGTRTPPITLTTTSQVATMMSIRSWWSELKLCVSSGAENVVHYQFLTKTTFSIRGATFVFKGYEDKKLVASKEVLEEIFTEQEVVPIYRAHFEIEKAKEEVRAAHGLPSTTTEAEGSGSSPSGSQA
ncbi:hypothetical protein HID58_018744 [Brassica napus]|uniref:Ubiquitin-like protease family profile domain-containing protein n=1 Tax=Brassica napus TaxID=3708 RepID=A0ABQ8DAU7_BRANA|nr:hypothetical protein HID58_018744 [Brassica napus]